MKGLILATGIGIQIFGIVYMLYAIYWYTKESKPYTNARIKKAQDMHLDFALKHLISTQGIFHMHMRIFSMMYFLGVFLTIIPDMLEGIMRVENFWFGILMLGYVVVLILNLVIDRKTAARINNPDIPIEDREFWRTINNVNFWVFWIYMFSTMAYAVFVM